MKKEDLNERFRVRILPSYSKETLDRNIRRVLQLVGKGMHPFNVEDAWVYEYCAKELECSKKRDSLRMEIEDLKRWLQFTKQDIKVPYFIKEAEQIPWYPSLEQLRKTLEMCSLKMKESTRDYLKQPEHERKWFRTALIIRTFAEGGMRNSELVWMKIDEERANGYCIRSSKKERGRFVSLSPAAMVMMERHIAQYRQKTDSKALWTSDYGRM